MQCLVSSPKAAVLGGFCMQRTKRRSCIENSRSNLEQWNTGCRLQVQLELLCHLWINQWGVPLDHPCLQSQPEPPGPCYTLFVWMYACSSVVMRADTRHFSWEFAGAVGVSISIAAAVSCFPHPFMSFSVFEMDEVKSQAVVFESILFYLCQKGARTRTILYVITWSLGYLQML